MALKILIGLVVVIVLLVVFVATRPAAFRVQRAVVISAPPEAAFDRVNDLRAWSMWSAYEKKDPDMKRTYGEKTAGPGATYAWDGDKNVGSGRMTIERSERPSVIDIKLEFFKPFEGTNAATFTFTPASGGTKVTWTMDGRKNFITKGVCLFMDMDKMIGTDFEAGLAALKTQAEADQGAAAAAAAR